MTFHKLFSIFIAFLSILAIPTAAQKGFNCSVAGAKCKALVEYITPSATTITDIQALFAVKNLRSILGANNLPYNTPPNYTLKPKSIIKVPITCACKNGSGLSNRDPIYTVQRGDSLSYIASNVFSRLVSYPDIQKANAIKNANLIIVGQKLWIPLPCSCDDAAGQPAVHYAHVVEEGSSLDSIAAEFGANKDVIMSVNGMANASDLRAGRVLDVPLGACASMVKNNSLDYPLRVTNGTYVITADTCVKCSCDAAHNWTLQCEPSTLKPIQWATCPPMQCAGADNLVIGNTTLSLGSCQKCDYAGFTNETVLTTLAKASTCTALARPPPDNRENKASRMGYIASSWILLPITLNTLWHYHQVFL